MCVSFLEPIIAQHYPFRISCEPETPDSKYGAVGPVPLFSQTIVSLLDRACPLFSTQATRIRPIRGCSIHTEFRVGRMVKHVVKEAEGILCETYDWAGWTVTVPLEIFSFFRKTENGLDGRLD